MIGILLRLALVLLAAASAVGYGGEWHYLFDVVSHFRVHLAAAAVVIALCFFLRRQKALGAVGLLLVAANLAGLWTTGTAPVVDNADGKRTISLMTFNIWARNMDVDAIAAAVLEADADYAVLQEYWPRQKRLRTLLKARYPWQLDCVGVDYCDSVILSKVAPVTSGHLVHTNDMPPALWATFGTGNEAFTLMSVHMDRPTSSHHIEETVGLARHIATRKGPFILAGDFNAAPWSYAMTRLRDLSGLRILEGYRPTWPAHVGFPQLPIDHVLVSDGISNLGAERGRYAGSDHLGVIARLALP